MANFQYFVHRTSGLIEDINTTNNLPEGGFYQLSRAIEYGKMMQDKVNFTAVYDNNGKILWRIARV